jgi:hydrogenase nickel incorporation protein HypA/HybF
MHELSITQHLVGLALKHAGAAGAIRVTDLSLVIGDLSTFSEDSVSFCWEFLARGTACEGARLHFQRVPAELLCLDCGAGQVLRGELAPCAACGSSRLKVTAGDDLLLESIEVETGDGEVEPAPTAALQSARAER